MTNVEWVPDTCTLPTVEQPLRVAELDALFAEHLVDVRRTGATEAALVLRAGPDLEQRVRDLTARESRCCSFFRFGIEPAGATLTLRVGVPAAQVAVLDALVSRAGGGR